MKDTITCDLRSERTYDEDGRLRVRTSRISMEAVNPYFGAEIPGYISLGLDPHKIYQMYRPGSALAEASSGFANLQILDKHIPVSASEPAKEHIIGATGSNVSFDTPYLCADMCIWDANAIAGIESGQVREISCAYRYVPVMEPGEFNGQAYDGRMSDIAPNHVAVVERGRAGSTVVVADGGISMAETMEEKIKELLKDRISDEGLDDIVAALLALMQPPEEGEEEAPEEEDAPDKEEEIKEAMDSVRSQLLGAMRAAKDVRHVIGDVVMDSASDIYALALDHLHVDHDGIFDETALRALFRVAIREPVADQAPKQVGTGGLEKQFPNIMRFVR